MSLQGVLPFVLDFLAGKPIEVEVSQAQLTDGAGLLPIRQFDEAIRLTARFGAALRDARGGRGAALESVDGPSAARWHSRRLRGPERSRHAPQRPGLQAGL